MKLIDRRPKSFSRVLWRYNNADAARGRRTMLYPRSSDVQMFNQIYHIKTNFKEENMKKNITLNGSEFAEICPEISCLKLVQFDKAAYLLYIFRISRFDNRKYFQIDKRVCLREICVEIDHFPIQPFHCCTALPQSSPSNKNLFFVLTLSKYRKWPSFLYARPKSNNFLPTFVFCSL